MTPEQAAAFVKSQSILLEAELEAMRAENAERLEKGQSPAHGSDELFELVKRYEPSIGYNAVLALYQGATP